MTGSDHLSALRLYLSGFSAAVSCALPFCCVVAVGQVQFSCVVEAEPLLLRAIYRALADDPRRVTCCSWSGSRSPAAW